MTFIDKIIKIKKLIKKKLWRKGLLNNVAANIELEEFIKDLNFNTLLDIGSNKGQFILLVENYFKEVDVHSFEPIKEILDKQKKLFKFKKNIFFYNFGIGEQNENKDFFITKRKDSSSFLKAEIDDNSDYKITKKIQIEIKSLDEILKDKNLIAPILAKIDVQGYELQVLKGANNLLKKIKYLIVEVSDSEIYSGQSIYAEILDYLKEKNFALLKESLPNKIFKTNYIQKDILFVNKSLN